MISAVCAFICTSVFAQDRDELESRRNALLRQIEVNTQLLSKARKEESATLDQIEQLNAEINLRQKLVDNYKKDLALMSTSLDQKAAKLARLKDQSESIANEFAGYLRDAWFEKKLDVQVLYLLSASSLNEAFARWRYLEAVSEMRRGMYERVRTHSDSIQAEVEVIQQLRAEKQQAAEDALAQERALATNKRQNEAALNDLRKEEKDIRATLDRQKRESARLAEEIERVISSEVATASPDAGLPMAPELKLLSEEFAGNKGKLPWPVDRGIITGHFGEQPHPVVPSIKISNNGIDITAASGTRVKALFNGKVVGVKTIPGYDYTVIVQHGSYYTVYSRLSSVTVKIGDSVGTGQRLGRLNANGGKNPKLHLEIWQNKVQVDPELWISR